jgi:D,D-heptose 1,7-bisphosphate phosphatase
MVVTQAVILAGGRGTRLGERSLDRPKPMQPVGGRPFLEHVVWNLRRQGVDRLVLSVGHLADVIIDHFGDGRRHGVSIDYVREESPQGTGGALRLCGPALADRFFLLNGDTLFDVNVADLALLARESGAAGALALRGVEDVSRYGAVVLDGHVIARFTEKEGRHPGLVSGGVAVLDRGILEAIPAGPCSLERDVFPGLAARRRLAGRGYSGFFLDIGLPETLDEAQRAVPAWRRKKALLLDRDGVLNVDEGYVCTADRFRWTSGAVAAIKAANDAGLLVLVITNQAGIARGYYSEDQFRGFTAWIDGQLRDRGAHVDGWYHCPHHPVDGIGPFKTECDCRKPRPGLVRQAVADWELAPDSCLMIGDKESDLEAAAACGIGGLRFDSRTDDLLDTLVRRVFPRLSVASPSPSGNPRS